MPGPAHGYHPGPPFPCTYQSTDDSVGSEENKLLERNARDINLNFNVFFNVYVENFTPKLLPKSSAHSYGAV